MYEFEFDERKSRTNLEKHGLDFVDAQRLWDDPKVIEIPAKTADEPRVLVIGLLSGKHWSAVITPRGGKVRYSRVRNAALGSRCSNCPFFGVWGRGITPTETRAMARSRWT